MWLWRQRDDGRPESAKVKVSDKIKKLPCGAGASECRYKIRDVNFWMFHDSAS